MNSQSIIIQQKVIEPNYGKILRQLRISRAVSQMEVEINAGLNFGTVCRIERGKINPSKETLIKISYVLDLGGEEILKLLGFNYVK